MNVVFIALVLIAFVVAAIRQIAWVPLDPAAVGPMQQLTTAMVDAAGDAVTLAIKLIGVMALFLGLMKVAEAGGLLTIIAKTIRPVMVRAFPDVPPDHPAMGAMILNFSANVLGLGNAATPFGIRAMQELDKLNPHRGTASDAMVLFLVINTSALAVLPTGVISLRAAAGSADPAGIIPTTLFATTMSTIVAILAAKAFRRFAPLPAVPPASPEPAQEGDSPHNPWSGDAGVAADVASEAYPTWVSVLALAGFVALAPLTVLYGRSMAPWVIPSLMVLLLGFGVARRVKTYEVFVEGARDGFQVALRIIPYLVAILVAVAMLRESGALDALVGPLGRLTSLVGVPGDALPVALLRPLSGSGSYAVVAATIQNPAIGPDSYTGYLVSTIQGSTETTFYVLAVYFGAIQVRRVRHTVAAGLFADLAGVAGAVIACSYLYGS